MLPGGRPSPPEIRSSPKDALAEADASARSGEDVEVNLVGVSLKFDSLPIARPPDAKPRGPPRSASTHAETRLALLLDRDRWRLDAEQEGVAELSARVDDLAPDPYSVDEAGVAEGLEMVGDVPGGAPE